MSGRSLALLAAMMLSQAVQSDERLTQPNALNLDPIDLNQRLEAATQWGLTQQEWQQYRQVMSSRRGLWSPGLDPLTALGVSTDSVAERRRYAELYVRTEFERTRKELAFQVAVNEAWARLYPETPRLKARHRLRAPSTQAVRYALIVSTECVDCGAYLTRRLGTFLDEALEGVDVHVVGTELNDAVLRDWLAGQPEVAQALRNGRITLNHGDEFSDLASFPAVFAKAEDGQWVREL